MDQQLPYFSSEDIHAALSYNTLIDSLRVGFTKDYVIPPRMHLDYDGESTTNTLLLMPAIQCGDVTGVKIITMAPDNAERSLPSIQGIYYLMDADTGTPKALMEAKALTNWRTAASSALAADYLAPQQASTLLMIGTGSLAPYLIDAHAAIRPIKKVLIYGRTKEKAKNLSMLKEGSFENVEVVDDIQHAIHRADIISVATLSSQPLVKGAWLKPGQHLDLVGSFKPSMREADDEAVLRSRIYVDTLEMAPKESGDLALPLETGIIKLTDIQGDLFQLCKGEVEGRKTEEEITLFKSVGHALEDLVTAQLLLKSMASK